MKKLIALTVVLAALLGLSACGSSSDVPANMQLVSGGEEYGYFMYAPEEWTVSNLGDIASAHASSVDTSSVSYVETEMPEGTVAEYFENSLSEFTFEVELVESAKETVFGNAESALLWVYDYEYSSHNFRTMQIFTQFEGRFGIFTFTSLRENISSSEKTQYEYYLDKINSVITNFKYVTKTGSPAPEKFTERDEDGYILSSDISLGGFSIYLPEEFTVDYSSGIVTAHTTDGSSVSVSRATSTGVSVEEYWENRKAELEALFGAVTLIEETESTKIGNSKRAAAYEYTYVCAGTTYHVYQVLAITTFNGYVFTYTAAEDNYGAHIDTVNKIAEKIVFK